MKKPAKPRRVAVWGVWIKPYDGPERWWDGNGRDGEAVPYGSTSYRDAESRCQSDVLLVFEIGTATVRRIGWLEVGK